MVKVHIDGATRAWGTSKSMGASAFVILENNKVVEQGGIVSEGQTNNENEYGALLLALTYLANHAGKYKNKQVQILCDSALVVNQVDGTWRCKAANLAESLDVSKALVYELRHKGVDLSLEWVSREKNEISDALCNELLDAYYDNQGS